jgi:hypothetical protein
MNSLKFDSELKDAIKPEMSALDIDKLGGKLIISYDCISLFLKL